MNRELLRYEQSPKPNKLLEDYTKRVKANDVLQDNEHEQKLLDKKEIHDIWYGKSIKKLRALEVKNEKLQLAKELKLLSKANLLVRRRALELQIEADQKKYAEELAQMGKAFHKQRI